MGKIFMTPEEVIEELGIGRETSKPESREVALRLFAERYNFPKPVPMGNGLHGYLIDDIKDWGRKEGKRLLEQKRKKRKERGEPGATGLSVMRKLQKDEPDAEPRPQQRAKRERLD